MITQILTHIQEHPDDPESWGDYAALIGAAPEELGQAMLLHNRSITAHAITSGRRGGLSTSPAKQAASRANGRKGGRPRKGQIER